MLECAYNRRLILNTEQYCHYSRNNVVADKLPASTLDRVAILAIKTVLSPEPLTGRFKGRQGIFNRAGNK